MGKSEGRIEKIKEGARAGMSKDAAETVEGSKLVLSSFFPYPPLSLLSSLPGTEEEQRQESGEQG